MDVIPNNGARKGTPDAELIAVTFLRTVCDMVDVV